MKKRSYQAFSLIELSIVILVIGIMVAGVMKGKELLDKARLKSAQTLTISAPVSGIDGLSLWLETSLPESFIATETEDGTHLSKWNDINPQNFHKYHGVKTASSEAVYRRNGINHLPSVYFENPDGVLSLNTTRYFTISTTNSIAGATAIQTPNNAFTYFLVARLDSLAPDAASSQQRSAFFNGNTNLVLNGWGYVVPSPYDAGEKRTFEAGHGPTTANNAVVNKAEIITGMNKNPSIEFSASCTDDAMKGTPSIYVNGESQNMSSSNFYSCVEVAGAFTVGATASAYEFWDGEISELIVYNRALSTKDRKAVEGYLSQKYGIILEL